MRNADVTTTPAAVRWLRWIALAAAALLTAHGEFQLAAHIGVTPWLAWLLPVGLDVYAFCAFAAGIQRDVRAALGLMIACQALAHLLTIGIIPAHWTLVIAVSAVAPIVCWRVHHLGEHHTPAPAAGETPPEPAADPTPEPRVEPTAEPIKPRVACLPAGRRATAETRALAVQIAAETPEITRKEIATRLGISERRLRTVLASA